MAQWIVPVELTVRSYTVVEAETAKQAADCFKLLIQPIPAEVYERGELVDWAVTDPPELDE